MDARQNRNLALAIKMVEASPNSSSGDGTNDARLKREPELGAGQIRPRTSDFPKDFTDIIYPALPIGGLSGKFLYFDNTSFVTWLSEYQ